jgi:radical SAM protein with 4Fe4S-binding SPASM domain
VTKAVSSPRQRLWNRYRDIATSQHELLYLFLEITRACNLSCRHCGSDCGATFGGPVLSEKSWHAIVQAVCSRFSRDLLFVITGGEPLLCPFLAGLGAAISARGRRWGMVTNGWALDATNLPALVDAGLSSITVSLDGDEETHGWLRSNPRAYTRALQAIDLIAASAVPWKDVVTCVFPGNLTRLDAVAATLLERGIHRWRLFRILPRGRARNRPELVLSAAQSGQLLQWIAQRRPTLRRAGLTVDFSCEEWLPYPLDRKVRTEPFFCRAGVNIASILCTGDVTGCPNNAPAFSVGNVLTRDFASLWAEGFGLYRDRAWMRQEECGECRNFKHCRGGSIHAWEDLRSRSTPCSLR